MKDYYHTKDGPDDWTVHGRRHHLQIVRTEGPSGREDRRGREIYQTQFLVKDRANVINLDDQYNTDAHGFTRLKDAIQYAVDKLGEYDEKVDPRMGTARQDPEGPGQDPFEFHLKPSGWTGAPCPICGCPAKNLRARHRALKADEAYRWGAPWIKRVKVAFGQDFSDEPIKG